MPNIIIIYADDLGYGDLSSYGGDIPTPNIDRIGKEGIRFTDFYVSAPACTPSRYSLLTGSFPQRSRHQLVQALMPAHDGKRYLDESETTLAAYLQERGYTTGLMGKWHLGLKDSTDGPLSHGFEVFSGFKGGCIDYFTHVYGQMGHDWYVNGKPEREKGYSTDLITDHAIRFIKRNSNRLFRRQSKPFFLFLAYNAPHYGKTDPDHIPEYTASLSEGKYLDRYGIINSLQAPAEYMERFAHIEDPYRRAYAAMVSSMDDNIGRLLKKLEKDRLLDHTMIWFISDNGGYQESYYGHSDNGGLRGEKGTLWEGGIRVPALLCWKERIAAGQVISTPVTNLDVLPTLGAVLGFDEMLPDSLMDGADISDVLFNKDPSGLEERSLYWKYRDGTALRKGDWKLVNGAELYNLRTDKNETTDLAPARPEKVKELREAWEQIDRSVVP